MINKLIIYFYTKGPIVSNKKTAKKAAALDACKFLHEVGEITDNLEPNRGKYRQLIDKSQFKQFPIKVSLLYLQA